MENRAPVSTEPQSRTATRRLKGRGPSPLALEQRFMFDGAAVVDAAHAAQASDAAHPDAADAAKDTAPPAAAPAATPEKTADAKAGADAGATPAEIVRAVPDAREIVFIDNTVPDALALAGAVRDGIEVVLIDGAHDPFGQISAVLAQHHDLTAVHLVSHGAAGQIVLGGTAYDAADLAGLGNTLAGWSDALAPGADFLLYGCDTGAGAAGQALVSTLAALTRSDVAASSDATGAAALGGNWTLEVATGTIETASPFTAAVGGYADLLDAPTVTGIVRQTPSYETTNADTVTFRVTFSEAVTGVTGNSFVFAPGSLSGATVQLVTAVANSGGTQYDVLVGGLGNGSTGTLNLDLAADSGIENAAHVALAYTNHPGGDAATDQTYFVDKSINAPTITGLRDAADGQGDTGASASDFVTRLQNLKIVGTADAGDTVRVFLDGHSIGLATADGSGQWVLDYTGTTIAAGSHSLTATASDVAGNTALSAAPVALVVDVAGPQISGATASDILVTLTYDGALPLDAVHTADPGAFTVKADGTAIAVKSVSVNAADRTVQLTLVSAVAAGQTVTVSYTDPTGGDDANAIQNQAGNDAASFTNFAAANVTNASDAAPTIGGVTGYTWYSKGDPAVAAFGGAPVLADSDDTYLESAAVQITANRNAADVLSIAGTLPAGISSSYDAATGTLTLSGHATLADYAAALSQVNFRTTAGLDADRTLSLTVNDGQLASSAATRTMRVLGQAFSSGDTASAYLVAAVSGVGGSGYDLMAVNLVMNTVSVAATLNGSNSTFTDFSANSLNAMGFNPIDGHLYAWDDNAADAANSNGAARVVRINSDGTVTYLPQPALGSSASGDKPATSLAPKAADINPNDGVMYFLSGNTIYRFDVNPTSATYLTWLPKLTLSQSLSAADLAFNPKDPTRAYVALSGNVYDINLSTGTVTAHAVAGLPSGTLWGQYFDNEGYLYVIGSSNGNISRIDVTQGTASSFSISQYYTSATTLASGGDAARIVTIELNYGDAPDTYKTTLAANGARHSILGNQTWLGNTKPGFTADGQPSVNANSDAADDGISSFSDLRLGTTSYSVDVQVTNLGSAPVTLVGWIDFNQNGRFDAGEAASIVVPAGTNNGTVTLTWTNIQGLSATGDTYARFRIASGLTTAATDGLGTGANALDARSYGPLMDGEVEDYKLTILAALPPDTTDPTATIVPVSPALRHEPAGTVTVTFDEAVTGVDIGDFTLTRDGTPVDITGLTVHGSGSSYTLDLTGITSPAGSYVLTLNRSGSGIKDLAGNDLANSPSISFTIDTTAPVIDLAPSDAGTRDRTTESSQGAAVSLDDDGDAATLVEASDQITNIAIQVGGLRDGANEKLIFGSTEVRADGNAAAQTGITVGGVGVDVAYANGIFTLTKNGGGEFTTAEAQAIVRDIQYRDAASGSSLTNGQRTFAFTATDAAGVTATPAVATVDVTGGDGNNGPLVPTVDVLHTNDTTPTLTGGATVGIGDTLTVTVNGQTYTLGGAGPYDGALSYDAGNHVWHLTIPDDLALSERTYSVTATVTDASLASTSDTTSNELVIDLTPPAAPTVVPQVTRDTTPTIAGTANVAADEWLTVTVDGTTYTEGDGHLVRINKDWTLTIPVDKALAENTYSVTATVHDLAGNSQDDGTAGELVIDLTPPTASVSIDKPALKIGDTATVTITFSEKVTGFDLTDLAAASGTLSNLASSDGGRTWTATFTPTADVEAADNAVTLDLAGVADLAGNAGSGSAASDGYAVDTRRPVIDLAPSDAATLDHAATSGNGAAVSLDDNADPATIVEGSGIATITLTTGGLQDGAAEKLLFGASEVRADGGSAALSNVTVGGIAGVDVAYAGGAFTITRHGGGAFTTAEAQAIVRDIQYRDAAATPGTGDRTLSFTVTDAAGNTSASAAVATVSVVPAPDQVVQITAMDKDTGDSANDFITRDGSAGRDVSGSISAPLGPNQVVEVSFDGGATWTTATTNGTGWTATDNGSHGSDWTIEARVTDTSSGVSGQAASQAVVLDTVAPTVSIGPVAGDDFIDAAERGGAIAIAGTTTGVEDGQTVTVTLNGHTYTATVSGNAWTLAVPAADVAALADGSAPTVTADVSDKAGNAAPEATRAIAVDATPPTIVIVSDKAHLKAGETATLSFTLSEAPGSDGFELADIAVTGGSLGNFVRIDATHYTAVFTPDANGSADSTVAVAAAKFNDAAGNANGASNTVSIAIDASSQEPTVPPPTQTTAAPATPAAPTEPAPVVTVPPAATTSSPVPPTPAAFSPLPAGQGVAPSPVVLATGDRDALARNGIGGRADDGLTSDRAAGILTLPADGALRITVIKADIPTLMRFHGVPDQNFDTDSQVRFQLPPDAFIHTQENAVVRVAATRTDGRPLPAWLVFDATSGKFEGTAPPNAPKDLAIKVIARDADGREASTIFHLRLSTKQPVGRPGLTEQIRQAGQRDRLGRLERMERSVQRHAA